jgi:hypothetical protein
MVVKGYWQDVRLFAQGREVAQHGRIWEKEQVRFEPLHYLAPIWTTRSGVLGELGPMRSSGRSEMG